MAQDSRKVRKERRLRRNLSLALQIAHDALNERDQARMYAKAALMELDKIQNPEKYETKVESDPAYAITQVDETEGTEPEVETPKPVELDGQDN